MKKEVCVIKMKNKEEKNTFYSFRLSRKVFTDNSKELTLAAKGLYAVLVADNFNNYGENKRSFKALQARTHTTRKTLIKLLDILSDKGYLKYYIDEKNKDNFTYQPYEIFI